MRAAVSVFSRYSYHEAGIREIAEETNCAVGTFYLYFSSKADVFVALIDSLYSKVMEGVMVGRSEAAGAEDKLAGSLDAVVGVLLHERDLARVVLVKTLGSDPMLENHLWHIHQTFADLLAAELRECGLSLEHARVGAWAFVGALAEIFILWAREPDLNLENMAQGVRSLFWQGWGLRAGTRQDA
jgi:AcrR family transcriptional regulator